MRRGNTATETETEKSRGEAGETCLEAHNKNTLQCNAMQGNAAAAVRTGAKWVLVVATKMANNNNNNNKTGLGLGKRLGVQQDA